MPTVKDPIPTNDQELMGFSKNMLLYVSKQVSGTSPAWKHVPPEAITLLGDLHGDFEVTLKAFLATKSPSDRAAKNLSKKNLRSGIRVFLNNYVRKNSNVTNVDLINLWLRVPDDSNSPVQVPAMGVSADLVFPEIGVIGVKNIHPRRDPTPDERTALHGVGIRWGIMGPASAKDKFRLTEVPESGDDLPHSDFTRRKNYPLDLRGESGNKVYICLRYENAKGGKGPWGPMLFANIP